jgi:hypothetical protein
MTQRTDRTKPSIRTKLTQLLSGRPRPIARDFPSAGRPAADKTAAFCPLKRVAPRRTNAAQSSKLATCNSRLETRALPPAHPFMSPKTTIHDKIPRPNHPSQPALPKNSVGAVSDRDAGLQPHNILRWDAKSASETPPTENSLGNAPPNPYDPSCGKPRFAKRRSGHLRGIVRWRRSRSPRHCLPPRPPCLPGASSDVDRYAHPDAR